MITRYSKTCPPHVASQTRRIVLYVLPGIGITRRIEDSIVLRLLHHKLLSPALVGTASL